MEMKRNELYDLISEICVGEYAIGIHGIDYRRVDVLVHMPYADIIESILNNGLRVYDGRSINGTVKFFGRIDIEEDKQEVLEGLNDYMYCSTDYILVAIPTILKTYGGNKLFLGKPNLNTIYKDYIGSRGEEKSSLFEKMILDDPYNNATLRPEYILGYFKTLDNGIIDFYINEKHISFRNGIVSQEYYDSIKKRISSYDFLCNDKKNNNLILEDIENVDVEKIVNLVKILEEKNVRRYAYICETLRQLTNENNLTKRKIESYNKKRLIAKHSNNKKNIVVLNKGTYYCVNDTYYININYATDKDKKNIMQYTSKLMYNYGIKSEWLLEHHDCIVPYLVDVNGEMVTDENKADAIGGMNIPEELMEEIFKELVETYKFDITCGNIIMSDKFMKESYEAMLKSFSESSIRK